MNPEQKRQALLQEIDKIFKLISVEDTNWYLLEPRVNDFLQNFRLNQEWEQISLTITPPKTLNNSLYRNRLRGFLYSFRLRLVKENPNNELSYSNTINPITLEAQKKALDEHLQQQETAKIAQKNWREKWQKQVENYNKKLYATVQKELQIQPQELPSQFNGNVESFIAAAGDQTRQEMRNDTKHTSEKLVDESKKRIAGNAATALGLPKNANPKLIEVFRFAQELASADQAIISAPSTYYIKEAASVRVALEVAPTSFGLSTNLTPSQLEAVALHLTDYAEIQNIERLKQGLTNSGIILSDDGIKQLLGYAPILFKATTPPLVSATVPTGTTQTSRVDLTKGLRRQIQNTLNNFPLGFNRIYSGFVDTVRGLGFPQIFGGFGRVVTSPGVGSALSQAANNVFGGLFNLPKRFGLARQTATTAASAVNLVQKTFLQKYGWLLLGLGFVLIIFGSAFSLPTSPSIDMYETAALLPPIKNEVGSIAEVGSKFIKLTKTASPNSFPNNNPGTVNYTILIDSADPSAPLSNIRISDSFSVFGGSGNPTISTPPINANSIVLGQPYTFSINLNDQFKDSVVTNTVTVTADAGGQKNETRSTSASVIVGNPPIGCFVRGGAGVDDRYSSTPASATWTDQEWNKMLSAISYLSRGKTYMSLLCEGGQTISLYRITYDFGGGSSIGGQRQIFFYNAAMQNGLGTTIYTLAHETGHVFNAFHWDIFDLYRTQGVPNEASPLPVCTYPNRGVEKNIDAALAEDFAEMIALYVGRTVYYGRSWDQRCGPGFDYQTRYPNHYDFVKNNLFPDVVF